MTTIGLSPKALWATVWAFALAVGLPSLQALIDFYLLPGSLDALPAPLRVTLTAALVALGVLLAAYRARPGVVDYPDAPDASRGV